MGTETGAICFAVVCRIVLTTSKLNQPSHVHFECQCACFHMWGFSSHMISRCQHVPRISYSSLRRRQAQIVVDLGSPCLQSMSKCACAASTASKRIGFCFAVFCTDRPDIMIITTTGPHRFSSARRWQHVAVESSKTRQEWSA